MSDELTTADKITVLLEFYRDVEDGLHDYTLRDDNSTPIFGMGAAWNHRSYRRLRELIPRLASDLPLTYWHVAEMYLRWRPNPTRRVAYCSACKREAPPSQIGSIHRHGQKTTTLMPRIRKIVSAAIELDEVTAGVRWLEDSWGQEVFLPEEIRIILGRGLKQEAA